MTRIVNILHLSDIHFSLKSSSYDQAVIFNALKSDLTKICDGVLKPDMIIMSGDLVNVADDEDIYLHFYDKVIDPLCKITQCGLNLWRHCPLT